MSQSFHDVQQVEVTGPTFKNGHSWTKIIITHRAGGRDENDEYVEITVKTEIALHHTENFHGVLPLVQEGGS